MISYSNFVDTSFIGVPINNLLAKSLEDTSTTESVNLSLNPLDLDYVLNSQVLWGTYEGVKNLAIYELIRAGSDMVIPIKYSWNGKEKIVNLGE